MGGENLFIEGTVTGGFGEGAVFMSVGHYKNEIKKKLGFDAYPGTLNLKVSKSQPDLLKSANQIKIEGFISKGRKFGGAACYKAKIRNINGAVIVPEITKQEKGIIEFIAPFHLKSKLKLKDGDKIKIELEK